MVFNRDKNVQIPSGATAQTSFAFSGKTNTRSILNTRRNRDRKSPLTCFSARATTSFTRIFNKLACPMTCCTCSLNRKKSLLHANRPSPSTPSTRLRLSAFCGAMSFTRVTLNRRVKLDGCLGSFKGIFKRNLQVIT